LIEGWAKLKDESEAESEYLNEFQRKMNLKLDRRKQKKLNI
jgi:hypothetical protein